MRIQILRKWYLPLILLISIVPRLWRINTDLQIHFDQGLHSLSIWKIYNEGKWSFLGHQTDTDGIFHGPIYYWLMMPSYLIGKWDPAAASIFQIILDTLGVYFLFSLSKELFSEKTALISSLIYAVSYGYISYARWLSNVTPSLPLSILFFLILYRFHRGNVRLLPYAAALASLITQLDGAIGVFLYPLLLIEVILGKIWKRISPKTAFISLVMLAAPHIPLFIFEMRHNFVITRAIVRLSVNPGQGVGLNYHVFILNLVTLFKEITNTVSFPFTWLAFLIVSFSLFNLNLSKSRQQTAFLVRSITIFFTALSLYGRGAAGFFFIPILPLITIIVSHAISSLPRYLSIILVSLLTIINIFHWKNFLTPSHALTPIGTFNLITNQDRKNVIDWIYIQSAGQPFAVWIYTIPYFLDDPWVYYFSWYGKSKYGYLPEKTGGFSPSDVKTARLFYNIYEPDDNQPSKLGSWLEEVKSNFGPAEKSFRSNDAIVEQRSWKR